MERHKSKGVLCIQVSADPGFSPVRQPIPAPSSNSQYHPISQFYKYLSCFFWFFFVFFKYVNNRILPPVLILFRFLMDIFFLTKEDRRSFQILVNPIFDNFTIFMKRHSGVAVSLILMSLGVTFTPLLPLHSYTSLFPNPTNPKTQ